MPTRLRPISMLCQAIQAREEAGEVLLDELMLGDVQELVDRLDEVLELCQAPARPYLSLTSDNRVTLLRNTAEMWRQRCDTLSLRRGTKGRQHQLEAFLQGALAVLTCARVLSHDDAGRLGFMVMAGRAEAVIERWAAERTDAQATEDCRARAAQLAQDARDL